MSLHAEGEVDYRRPLSEVYNLQLGAELGFRDTNSHGSGG